MTVVPERELPWLCGQLLLALLLASTGVSA